MAVHISGRDRATDRQREQTCVRRRGASVGVGMGYRFVGKQKMKISASSSAGRAEIGDEDWGGL